MPGPSTISFPDPDPVTGGPPTIDGWTGNQDPGLITSQAEPGYATGDRVTYEGGSAFPPVTFQSVRIVNPAGMPAGTYLALGFFCSFDASFDDADTVVIALRKQGSTLASDTRRLDIHPVRTGIGAGVAADPEVVLPGTPAGTDFHVRLDRTPRAVNVWKGQTPTGTPAVHWQSVSASNIVAKCASWRPGVITAQTVGTTTLPAGASTTFTMNVNSTGGFPPSGGLVATVAGIPRLVSYDAKTATSFTGCRSSAGAGTLAAGSVVSQAAVGWSIEVLVPTTTAPAASGGGGGDWLALDDGFGVYFNIVRLSPSRAGGTTFVSGHFATQYVFPVGGALLTGTLGEGTAIASTAYGTARIGNNLGIGVGFQNTAQPMWSIGARSVTAGANSAPTGVIQGPGGTNDNVLVAQVRNSDPANAAADVTAEFRLANWGLPPATFPAWAPAQGAAAPSVVNLSVSGGPTASDEVLANWPMASVPASYVTPDSMGFKHNHQCMWVRLTSTSTAHFFQGGARRNMDIQPLSEHEEGVEISGIGYDTPPAGSKHDFVLIPHVRAILVPDYDRDLTHLTHDRVAQSFKKVWVWIVDGFRRTGQSITIEGVTADVLDPTPGQFGLIATHDDADDVLGYVIDIPGFEWRGGALVGSVPAGGSVSGRIRLKAASREEIAKDDEDRLGGPTPEGCLKRILKLLGLAALGVAVMSAGRR